MLLDAAKPYFIAALHGELSLPVVVITAQPEDARRLYEQLQLWCSPSATVHRFPELDLLPYEHLPAPAGSASERSRVLASLVLDHDGSNPPLIVSSALATISTTFPPTDFASACHSLGQGMPADPLDLLRRWQAMGYELEDIVEVPGTMTRRGGIIDIFPVCSQSPARIEFSGRQIESLRFFDPESQRSTGLIASITITPAREVSSSGNVLDYLDPNALVIVDAPKEIRAVVDRLIAEAQELEKTELESAAPRQAASSSYFTWDELSSRIRTRKQLILEPWDAAGTSATAMLFTSPQSYGGRLESFLETARQMIADRQRVLVVSHQANRLAELLEEKGVYASVATKIDELPPRSSITLLQG
ncbi:MAG: hypothetical protein KAX25_03765, partial [Dehalococcoidia bacterium]|nr:hypothetical protein [Dehalococcoidia bacterium]